MTNTQTYATREEARAALRTAGFRVGFSSPGRPELWIHEKQRKATAQQLNGTWRIVDYPGSSACNPRVVADLAVRDYAMLQRSSATTAEDDLAAALRLTGLADECP